MDTSDVNMLREIFYEAEFGSRSESGVGTLNKLGQLVCLVRVEKSGKGRVMKSKRKLIK